MNRSLPYRRMVCVAALALGTAVLTSCGSPATGEDAAPSAAPWALFVRSFDLFTLVLLLGSFVAVSLMIRSILDINASKVLPPTSLKRISEHLLSSSTRDLEPFVRRDDSMPARVLHAAIEQRDHGESAMRDAADMAVGDEVARLLRRIEPLQLIGNIAPLVGLAGTVWGMILAFTSLGETGGQAGPAALSLGISKALFHTLLGLCLAIPCLAFFGTYKARIDRICTRGMSISTRHLERMLDIMRGQDDETSDAAVDESGTSEPNEAEEAEDEENDEGTE
ncbi:MAG: MotA/TolQ/ExbB proton channel family protein [Phycisphaeraceae bacterium]|nr:MotA/TolQ/ExbB proton channel family protein [Phycisphaerales bacterium]MCB9859924.1 MotA/TolQ/ExbB proton channel family protein [Phycisphaeraceae bacterium]